MFLIPIHICYDVPFEDILTQTFENISPSILMVDIFINLFTGYYERGLVIYGKVKIL